MVPAVPDLMITKLLNLRVRAKAGELNPSLQRGQISLCSRAQPHLFLGCEEELGATPISNTS